LSYLSDTQANKQTNSSKNINSLAEVKISSPYFVFKDFPGPGKIENFSKDLWACGHPVENHTGNTWPMALKNSAVDPTLNQ